MILYPPRDFDINEWYIITSVLSALTIIRVLPKRFSTVETTVFIVFGICIALIADTLIGLQPYDLYDICDSPKIEVMDMVLYFFGYPPFIYIYLYFYDKWQLKGFSRILYIIGCSLTTTALEYLAHRCYVYTYKGWEIWYSPFVYIVVYALSILVFNVTQKSISNEK